MSEPAPPTRPAAEAAPPAPDAAAPPGPPPEAAGTSGSGIPFSAHMTFVLCGLMVVAFAVWSSVSTLDIVSMATGEVIPSTQVKTVQHLEGGIIRKVLVREGEQIKRGQSLLTLEPTASQADVDELRVRLRSLSADLARLEALTKGLAAPIFPEKLVAGDPVLVRQSITRFDVRRRRHQGEVRRQEAAVAQRQQEIAEITTRISSSRQSLKLVNEQIKISEELMKDNLTNRFQHLDLLKESRRLSGGVATDQAALARARSALAEARAELENIRNAFDEDNQTALDEARLNYAELNQRVRKFEDSLKRTTVRSPVDGVVKTLHVFTVGGVVRPGDPIAEIVPAGDRLIVEAKLPTQDIGYVAAGQLAVVKLASADAMRFGGLNGTVINVSPDTLISPEGDPFYKVRIETEKGYFARGDIKYNLFPGMQVMASIHTGERTVLQYLIDPIRYSMGNAAQER
ncbi:MAG: HlyD family type I secretion periplasmic adaptor subunit [Magnetovibrio sp.]|nr:HlyD family type I secretion periplasmic adaptor subunit [Magnetovibrio sp.]